ncbi:hypothetical protein MRB99_004223, partial [Cronobacter sakazakii]|nr:hypothetical protein [Cronobacter sakazakii]
MEEELLLPRVVDREALKKEADKLREAVLNGTVVDRVLTNAIRKELNKGSIYNAEWTLDQHQYISSIFHMKDLTSGVNLINSSVGTGKTSQFIQEANPETNQKARAKPGYIVLVPLTSIRLSFEGDNDVFSTGI